jgi:threonine/homoserine/homoserine lactone efflux protein
MTRKFDVRVALLTFHAGMLVAILGTIISIFFLANPYNIFFTVISILIAVFLMFKGYKIGKSLKK